MGKRQRDKKRRDGSPPKTSSPGAAVQWARERSRSRMRTRDEAWKKNVGSRRVNRFLKQERHEESVAGGATRVARSRAAGGEAATRRSAACSLERRGWTAEVGGMRRDGGTDEASLLAILRPTGSPPRQTKRATDPREKSHHAEHLSLYRALSSTQRIQRRYPGQELRSNLLL